MLPSGTMTDLATLSIDELTRRLGRRVGLIDEVSDLLTELADRVDDFGEHEIAEIMRDQSDDIREHARRIEILDGEKHLERIGEKR